MQWYQWNIELELGHGALKCHEIKYPAGVSEVSSYVSYQDYEVFFTLFFLFCSFYFFPNLCFSVLSPSRQSWTLAVSHSHSVRIDWPNFLEKVFHFHCVFCLRLLPLFSAEISDKAQSLSVPAAPNVHVAVEHSNPLLQISPTITPDKNADIGRFRLRSVMQWWSNVVTVLAFYNICTWRVWFGLG